MFSFRVTLIEFSFSVEAWYAPKVKGEIEINPYPVDTYIGEPSLTILCKCIGSDFRGWRVGNRGPGNVMYTDGTSKTIARQKRKYPRYSEKVKKISSKERHYTLTITNVQNIDFMPERYFECIVNSFTTKKVYLLKQGNSSFTYND